MKFSRRQTLSKVEFIYNKFRNQITQLSPFEIVYGWNHFGMFELMYIFCIERLSIQAEGMKNYLRKGT